MTTSTPHILTLPRELRDLVYDHLVQDVNFQYKWSDHGYKYNSDKIYDVDDPDIARALTYPKLSSDIAVYLHEASPPNALLTHFRFNDELKNRSLSNRSATIRIKQQRGWKFPLPLPTRLSGVSVNDALFEVRHITILVCGGSRLDDGRENWIYLEKLIKKLTHKMPHLTTIRVAQRSNVDVFVMSPEQLATCKLFTKPPEQVSGFSLAQRTETYRMPSGPWPSIIQMGYCTYQIKDSTEDCSTEHFWTPEQIMEVWPRTLAQIPGLSYKLEEWREKRGFAESKAWF
jgi:hypothetical protein